MSAGLATARGPLYAIAGKNPTLAATLIPRMLARTPDERRVHEPGCATCKRPRTRAWTRRFRPPRPVSPQPPAR